MHTGSVASFSKFDQDVDNRSHLQCGCGPLAQVAEAGPWEVSSWLKRWNGENWLAAPMAIAACSTALPDILLRTEEVS